MSKKQKKMKVSPKPLELQSALDEIQNLAKKIVDDYIKNPSQISGSMVQVHSEAPILKNKLPKKPKN